MRTSDEPHPVFMHWGVQVEVKAIITMKTHWKRPWCRERLKAGGQGNDRGWDGWMASPTQWTWTWVWASSGSCWWTGKPGMLQSLGLKESDTTEQLNWTWREKLTFLCHKFFEFQIYFIQASPEDESDNTYYLHFTSEGYEVERS